MSIHPPELHQHQHPDAAGRVRPQPPAVWPVAVWTLLFGIFGGLSAARRAKQAAALGVRGHRYWGTFLGLLVPVLLVQFGIVVAVAVPVYLNTVRTAEAKVLASMIVRDGQANEPGQPRVELARCTPLVAAGGRQPYQCVVNYSDTSRRVLTIVADGAGGWVVENRE